MASQQTQAPTPLPAPLPAADAAQRRLMQVLFIGVFMAALEPLSKPWGQIVPYVRCPDGTLVEICSPVAT
jgi:hypothetical protein